MILPILGVTTPTDIGKININLVPQTAQVQPEKIEPTKYTVLENDNLTKIADKHQTTWQRLWNKNTHLTNQDVLNVGEIIVIPSVDEVLADRPLYKIVSPVPANGNDSYTPNNSYEKGSCTWGVKNWKPEVGNWSNANNWGYAAASEGWTVSDTPVVGAVAWTARGEYGHVALVLATDGDTVTIKEQNYDWNGSVRVIDVPTTNYRYIYK